MRRFPSLLAALAVAVAVGAGCGEDTPQGREAASPADRVATPAPGAAAAPGAADAPAPGTDAEDRDPVPRAGAPAVVGEAPERPVTGAVPDPRLDR